MSRPALKASGIVARSFHLPDTPGTRACRGADGSTLGEGLEDRDVFRRLPGWQGTAFPLDHEAVRSAAKALDAVDARVGLYDFATFALAAEDRGAQRQCHTRERFRAGQQIAGRYDNGR